MTTGFPPRHVLVATVAAVLAWLCTLAPPASALDPITLQITSSAPLEPGGNPQFPRENAQIPDLVGPLRLTVVLSASAADGETGACATYTFAAVSCKRKKGNLSCTTPK